MLCLVFLVAPEGSYSRVRVLLGAVSTALLWREEESLPVYSLTAGRGLTLFPVSECFGDQGYPKYGPVSASVVLHTSCFAVLTADSLSRFLCCCMGLWVCARARMLLRNWQILMT